MAKCKNCEHSTSRHFGPRCLADDCECVCDCHAISNKPMEGCVYRK